MDLSIMASGEVFLSYLHSLRKKWNLRKNSTSTLHALVVFSLVFPSGTLIASETDRFNSPSENTRNQITGDTKPQTIREVNEFMHPTPRVGVRASEEISISSSLTGPIQIYPGTPFVQTGGIGSLPSGSNGGIEGYFEGYSFAGGYVKDL